MTSPVTARSVVVAGATGLVGTRLVKVLAAAGYDVRAMTRNPDRYHGAGRAVAGDVHDPETLGPAFGGSDIAYYLVHSLDDADFEARRQRGRGVRAAAAAVGVREIIYLGGLGAEDPQQLSPHRRSRRQAASRLAEAGVPVTVLRAAIVVGDGGVSWEITRQLVKTCRSWVTPRWDKTRNTADRPE